MRKLLGKTALVTGGSRGIGAAIARRLGAEGASVAINCRQNSETAQRLAQDIQANGARATVIVGDITEAGSASALFSATEAHLGPVDILINNAGVFEITPFMALTEEGYDSVFAITKAVYFLMAEAGRRLQDGGRIISMSTGLTRNWAPGAAAYAGSKAAIEVFTRSLSRELGARGITVNSVLPGVTETDMTAGFPEERLRAAAAQTAFGRLGQPGDIADVVAFLASDESRWITGQSIVANGGSTP